MENNQVDETNNESGDSGGPDFDRFLNIPLKLTVELGNTRMAVNDLIQLGNGTIVELNKLAGEPLDIFINDKMIGRGVVVVVNEKFGVRVTEIISQMDRIKELNASE